MFFSIGGRPTQELVFATEDNHLFAIGEDGEFRDASDVELAQLRWSLIRVEVCNDDTGLAIDMARQHAADNGWLLSDVFYYD